MDWSNFHQLLLHVQHSVSVAGIIVILSGVLLGICQYIYFLVTGQLFHNGDKINLIRLNLGRILILGLEFIVAADLIGTTTTPDYYAIGLAAIIVLIRTLLSFSLNRELIGLSKK